MTNIPQLNLKAQYETIRAEIKEAIESVLESQHFVLGPTVRGFEESIAQYICVNHAIGCGSGSDAILIPLMAINVGPGDEVICPSFTFFATAGSVSRLGATPVFVDIDPSTYNINPECVREAAKKCHRLKAIMPVHLYGQPADMDACLEIGEEFGVPIIEDAAQAIGATDESGQQVGTRGVIGCFSCYPAKNLGGYGEAGFITTNDDALATRMSILRVQGMEPKYYHKEVGFNSRLDAIQAAVLSVKLRHLEEWTEGRRAVALWYDEGFMNAGAATTQTPLDASDGDLPVRIPHRTGGKSKHIFHQYVIRVASEWRDALKTHLASLGIGSDVYYPVPLHLQECFQSLGYRVGDLPHSEQAACEVLALPMYPELTQEQVRTVVHAVCEFLSARTERLATASELPVQ